MRFLYLDTSFEIVEACCPLHGPVCYLQLISLSRRFGRFHLLSLDNAVGVSEHPNETGLKVQLWKE